MLLKFVSRDLAASKAIRGEPAAPPAPAERSTIDAPAEQAAERSTAEARVWGGFVRHAEASPHYTAAACLPTEFHKRTHERQ